MKTPMNSTTAYGRIAKVGAADRSKLVPSMTCGSVSSTSWQKDAAATMQVARVVEASRKTVSRRRAWPAPPSRHKRRV